MEFKFLKWQVEGPVGTLTINSPDTLNALSGDILEEMEVWVKGPARDESLRCILITGEGRAFVAGANIAEMSKLDVEGAGSFGRLGSGVFRMIEELRVPVIAAINGFALGGGCELALACDIRLASDKAKLGQPEVGLGITPGFSGTVRLPRVVGLAKAKELVYTARVIRADEALSIGLVNQVYPAEELMDKAMEMAGLIAANSGSAVSKAKEALNRTPDVDTDTAIALERGIFALCFGHEDQKEGMGAFLEKRNAEFK